MGYVSGVAVGQKDLIDRLENFLSADGWPIHFSVDETNTGGERRICTSITHNNETVYCTIESNYNFASAERIRAQLSTSFDSTRSASSQPGAPSTSLLPQISVPKTDNINYWLFTDQQKKNLYLVCGMGDWFQHLYFGTMETVGGFQGGIFLAGSWGMYYSPGGYNQTSLNPRAHMVCWPADYGCGWCKAGTVWWFINRNGTATNKMFPVLWPSSPSIRMEPRYWKTHPNAVLPILIPVLFFTSSKVPVGYMKDLYFCVMDKFTPGEEVSIGADTYMLFPIWNKNHIFSSNPAYKWLTTAGVAIKKVL